MTMGLFDRINTAKTQSNGDYFPPIDAKYVLQIAMAKVVSPRKKPDAICVELDVIECDQPAFVGKRFSFYQGSDGEYFDAEIRTFMLRLMGFGAVTPEGEEWANRNSQAMWEQAIDPIRQPLQGMRIRCATFPKVTKQNQKTITICNWEPWYNSHQEALAAMRIAGTQPRLDVVATGSHQPPPPVGPMYAAPPPPPPPLPMSAPAWERSPDGYYIRQSPAHPWVLAPR
jgi:hypothetical protein